MLHSDFYSQILIIKTKEQEELRTALRLHGDSFVWEEKERPIIAINTNIGPIDVAICAAKINKKHNILQLQGINHEHCFIENLDIGDVFAGHLAYVIDKIPAVGIINDVSLNKR